MSHTLPRYEWMIGNKLCLGRVLSNETKTKISRATIGNKRAIGHVVSMRAREHLRRLNTGTRQSPETIEKKASKLRGGRLSIEARKNMSLCKLGSKNPSWKGGITPEHRLIRKTVEYKIWREAVFRRDNWSCVWCGERGGRLEADHIKRFSEYPELRFVVKNGRTLCVSCHKKTENYGRR